MHIEYDKFLALTALLTVGAAAAVGPSCTVNKVENDSGDDGGESSTGGKSSTTNTNAGTAGTNAAGGSSGRAGATSLDEFAGTAGAIGTTGAAGTAGAIGTTGAAGTAGAIGTTGSAGSAGSLGAGGAAGSAGATNTAGTAGTAACVAGDPASEGGGIDCTQLSYYWQDCPDPSGEGTTAYGVETCWRYAYQRQGAAQVLFDCLKSLVVPAGGWCSSAHAAAVDVCVTKMEQATCVSAAAQSACAAIHAKCTAVTVSDCVADLSPLDDGAIATIEPCMEGTAQESCVQAYRYSCAGFPNPNLDVSAQCATVTAGCTALTTDTCVSGLNSSGTGLITKRDYDSIEACLATRKAAGGSCDVAFADCT